MTADRAGTSEPRVWRNGDGKVRWQATAGIEAQWWLPIAGWSFTVWHPRGRDNISPVLYRSETRAARVGRRRDARVRASRWKADDDR